MDKGKHNRGMKCPECGCEITDNGYPASCAGAEAEERSQNVNLAVKGTQGIPSCYCCDTCREKCFKSWQQENTGDIYGNAYYDLEKEFGTGC